MKFADEIGIAQRVYKDILNGFSCVQSKDYGEIFLKHLSDLDHGYIQEYKKQVYEEAKKRGIFTEQEKIKICIEQEVWGTKKEKRLSFLTDEVLRLQETKNKFIIKSQVKSVQIKIDTIQKELEDLEKERLEVLDITCENYSSKKVNEYYVYYTLFKDSDLKERLLDLEEFEELEPVKLSQLVLDNNDCVVQYSPEEIKKIAASPFFLNSIMISKGNPTIFYGKPIMELTNYQQDLFQSGVRFKSIIENEGKSPPPSDSLQELVDWYDKKVTKKDDEKDNAGATVFGASREELDSLAGEQTPGIDLHDAFKKSGKKQLSLQDMLKLHGEI